MNQRQQEILPDDLDRDASQRTAVVARLKPHEIKTFRIVNLRLVSCSISFATLALIASLWMLDRA